MKSIAAWLTPRRLRAQALILAVCLWGVCAVDFATPGLFDRAGNIKFQDFLPIYVAAHSILQGHPSVIYERAGFAEEVQQTILQLDHGRPSQVVLPYLYGPQVALFFAPLARFSFLQAASIWSVLSLLVYFLCVRRIWKSCPTLRCHGAVIAISAAALPAAFHNFVRGQLSVLPLLCFTAAFLALRAQRNWLAGAALGLLFCKPPFLVAIPLVLLLGRSMKMLAGLILSAAVQGAFLWFYFGSPIVNLYLAMLLHPARWAAAAELTLAPIQMHSLRAFWSLLIPNLDLALSLYILSSAIVVAVAAATWKSSLPMPLRFSALILAAVLVNPHLFIYDLLVLGPALMFVTDWILSHPDHRAATALGALSYLAFTLPLLGPLSRWTHLQLSVIAFAWLLVVVWHISRTASATPSHKLASSESGVV